eukprot:CAMPEP_0169255504 /NCGR_PEP_ID=MMETSP1016-20121227/39776_1 /TAXON_ID=342587 /ORGANISM="Karlodinium micrum, Strain CCMP2283" /LENGTH=55 /DNA_ID=CAMNT_0009337101 /DNA_START=71 /DNA_END=238 /DNA_ORIENTATION=-
MPRQLPGKEKKETGEQKRARKASNAEAQEKAKYVLAGIGGVFAFIFLILLWKAHS